MWFGDLGVTQASGSMECHLAPRNGPAVWSGRLVDFILLNFPEYASSGETRDILHYILGGCLVGDYVTVSVFKWNISEVGSHI